MSIADVKQAAAGRWPQILRHLVPEVAEALDATRHVHCPLPGHADEKPSFRFKNKDEGKAVCTCGKYDGFDLLRQLRGWDFSEAKRQVAEHLGVKGDNGRPDPLEEMARLKRCPIESLRAYHARVDRDAVWIPMHGYPLSPPEKPTPCGWQWFGRKNKYKGQTKKGGRNGVFLPGRAPAAGETWIFVEGAKDASALHSMGYLAAGHAGNTLPQKTRCEQLFAGCHVVIVPDLDKASFDGAEKTTKRLCRIAESVRIARLPGEMADSDGKDVRDILQLEDGESLVREAIEKAAEVDANESDSPIIRIAEAICADSYFAQDAGGKLFRYSEGVYAPHGDEYIKRQVKHHASDEEWCKRLAAEVTEYIRVDAPHLWERPPQDHINLANGILRLSDRQLLAHTPDHLSRVQLPVGYDAAATCPATERFAKDCWPTDAGNLPWQVAAWLIDPSIRIQKALLLLGEGGNGKSRQLMQYANLLGRSNIAAISLHKLESSRFASARLLGKLADICPDLPSEHLTSTGTFKAITGGDRIEGEYKHGAQFEFLPWCRLLFSANHPPRSEDASQAFFDRWLPVPFDARFREEDREVPEAEMDARLSAPGELSGLLNKALEVMPELRRRGRFSLPASVRDAMADFRSATDPFSVWLNRHTVDDPRAVTPIATLRNAYGKECERRGRPTPTTKAFSLAVQRERPGIEKAQRTVSKKVVWCYVGIGIAAASHSVNAVNAVFPTAPSGECNEREKQEKAQQSSSTGEKRNPVNRVKRVKPKGDDQLSLEVRKQLFPEVYSAPDARTE